MNPDEKMGSPLERAGEILARAALKGRKKPQDAQKALVFDAAAHDGAESRFDAARLALLADAVARSAPPGSRPPMCLEQARMLLAGLPKTPSAQVKILKRVESLLREADRELSMAFPGRKAVFPP